MSFVVMPPEINSLLIYTGAGPGPLLAAAAAWDELAAELGSAAAAFGSVTSGLVGGIWQGPSSVAMAAAAAPYAGWLSAAAASAESAAGQARAVVGVFEAALAATVDPFVIAANRSRLVSLALSNLFGQNTPAIAAAEFDYELMWAQDVAAMLGYHTGASAAAEALAPFGSPLASLAAAAEPAKSLAVNLGLANVGLFNAGSGNVGSYNVGAGNVGLFNSGSGNIGIGNSGSLNSGIGTSGTINAGLGSAGSLNTSFWNAGMQNAALGSAAGSEAALVSSAGYATGGMSTAALSSGILASALGSTGGLQHGLANVLNSGLTNTPVAAPASAPVGGLDSGNPNPGSGSAAAGSGANPGLRSPGTSYPSFVNSGSNDSGLRNTAVREPSTPGSGIPKSNFYPSPDRESAYASPRIGQPVGSE